MASPTVTVTVSKKMRPGNIRVICGEDIVKNTSDLISLTLLMTYVVEGLKQRSEQ